jgi:hypothetical protein
MMGMGQKYGEDWVGMPGVGELATDVHTVVMGRRRLTKSG